MRMIIRVPELPAEWTEWFAWRPVFVSGEVVWLETIERKFYCSLGSDGWKYR